MIWQTFPVHDPKHTHARRKLLSECISWRCTMISYDDIKILPNLSIASFLWSCVYVCVYHYRQKGMKIDMRDDGRREKRARREKRSRHTLIGRKKKRDCWLPHSNIRITQWIRRRQAEGSSSLLSPRVLSLSLSLFLSPFLFPPSS